MSVESSRRKSTRLQSKASQNYKYLFDDGAEEEDVPKRSTKRARTSRKGKGKSKNVGKLSTLPKMPMDILFLIFSFLPPQSLLSLTRVNHVFRDTLLSKSSVSVWITMRNTYQVPKPSEDLSEPEWAKLLFDGTRCQVCGAKGVTRVDFILQRRICYGCVRHNGVSAGRFNSAFWGEDDSVLEYVIPTPGYGGYSPTMYYNLSEVEIVLSELSRRRGPDLEAYIKRRQAYNQRLQDHAVLCNKWLRSCEVERAQEAAQLSRSREEAVKQRLLEMGYSEEDARSADYEVNAVYRSAPLTERSWTGMRPALLSHIHRGRLKRLLFEQETELASRCELVQKRLLEHRISLPPKEWQQLPSLQFICALPSLRDLLARPDRQVVTDIEVDTAFAAIPEEIEAWLSQLKSSVGEEIDQINRMVYKERGYRYDVARPHFKMAQEEFDSLVPTPGQQSLEMATTWVSCLACRKSWSTLSTAIRHSCGRVTSSQSERATFGVSTMLPVITLLQLSGMDIISTTADEMDDKGVVFRCTRKDRHRVRSGSDADFIGTWRSFVGQLWKLSTDIH
ncbi:hypothetical protein VNI00_014137 [Paramarasmius palmivorus]|uniref:F-box domain-containing protein n=1 Tax=Paramarasmius palmivorus TaxID=297713 RepID=A0AAW0BVR3_9AGAR